MTALATKALDLSDTFNVMFEGRFLGFVIELGKPGMSTAGGKQSVQHIALQAQAGGSIVVGSVEASWKRAALRSHVRIAGQHRQRFGTELPIGERDWNEFCDRAERFLREEGFDVERDAETTGVSPVPEVARAQAARGVSLWVALLIALLFALLAVTVTVVLLRGDPAPPPAVPAMPAPQ
jgi:hypothetical protein